MSWRRGTRNQRAAKGRWLTSMVTRAIKRTANPTKRSCTTFMASRALLDIYSTLDRHDLWRTLGWADIRFRYRRTTLGPFWLTLSTGVMVFAIGLLYAGLFHQELASYIPSLAIGLIVWNFFITSVTEGCSVFIGVGGLIKAYTIPLPIYVMRLVWRNIIVFLHNFLVIAVAWLAFRWELSWLVCLSVIGYFIMIVLVLGVILFFAVLCTRFRDVPQIVASVLQLLFFITPIMWLPNSLGSDRWVADYNPLYSVIELVRAPLLNQAPEPRQWLIGVGCALISLVFGTVLYDRYGYRVPYWL
jgi:ABC-type polysaccharide/polyol phosphate export permease